MQLKTIEGHIVGQTCVNQCTPKGAFHLSDTFDIYNCICIQYVYIHIYIEDIYVLYYVSIPFCFHKILATHHIEAGHRIVWMGWTYLSRLCWALVVHFCHSDLLPTATLSQQFGAFTLEGINS